MNKFRAMCICLLIFCIFGVTQLFSRSSDFIVTPRLGLNSLLGDIGEDAGMGLGLGINFEYMYKENVGLFVGMSYNTFPSGVKSFTYDDDLGNEFTAKFDYSLSDISLLFGIDYYIFDYHKKISPFIGLEAGYIFISQELTPTDNTTGLEGESSTDGYSQIAPHVGVSYPLNKNMFLTLRARYMLSFVNVQSNNGFGTPTQSVSVFSDYNYISIQAGYSYIF